MAPGSTLGAHDNWQVRQALSILDTVAWDTLKTSAMARRVGRFRAVGISTTALSVYW